MEAEPPRPRFDRHEMAGAVADLGVLVPIAVALIVKNGLEATAVLLPAGLLYLAVAFIYRLPVPVQPLKAFGAIAIAKGLGADEIAAGALLMGAIFLLLGITGLVDVARRAFPRPLIRGVQLTVGLLLLKIAWGLVRDPPKSFDSTLQPEWAIPIAAVLLVTLLVLRKRPVAMVLVAAGLIIAVLGSGDRLSFGPSGIDFPSLDATAFWAAFTALVVPQVPLTFANSCLATADAARTYFGEAAERVKPGRLATTLGVANLFSGAISGMPVCHGAGGMTAHYTFGARTAGAPLAIGAALVLLAIGLGASLAVLLASFPLTVLAALLGAAGLLHIGLLRDLESRSDWVVALTVGIVGFGINLALALALGLIWWWLGRPLLRRQYSRS
jgi:MFS superfamily sulfate permease-like transporter